MPKLYTLFEDIVKLNEVVWQNPKGSYDDFSESSMQVEEALEGFTKPSDILYDEYGNEVIDPINSTGMRNIARDIVRWLKRWDTEEPITDVERFDKHLDSIYLNIGALHKLGLDVSQMVEGLAVVHEANSMKAGTKDSTGKVIKQANWDQYAPEPKLQAILDRRSI